MSVLCLPIAYPGETNGLAKPFLKDACKTKQALLSSVNQTT